MKTSLRTLLLFVTTVASYVALFTIPRSLSDDDPNVAAIYIFVGLVAVPLLTCFTTASIAFDQRPTRRAAIRGALVGIYLMFAMMILQFGLFPPVT